MAVSIETILSQGNCFACLPPGQQEVAKLALLANIAGTNTPATIDVAAILGQAQCLACLSEGELSILEVALLSAIATANGV